MTLWLWLIVPAVGLLLGLFGAGGGMLTVPLLMYGGGFEIKEAIATSLWIVAVASMVAAIQQRFWEKLQLKLMLFFGVSGVFGGLFGAWIGTWIHPLVQQIAFGLLVLMVAIWMLRAKVSAQAVDKPCPCQMTILIGAFIGFITGMVGVGGGFLMVPALIFLGITHMPTAVVHSLVLISFNATASGLVYLDNVRLSLPLLLALAMMASIGSLIGSRLLKRLSGKRLQQSFSAILVMVGCVMLIQSVILYTA